MKNIIFIILIWGLKSTFCTGQEKEIIDSIFINSDAPSKSKLLMLENCEKAYIMANQDIDKNTINLLIVGGISPVVYPSDKVFEMKYQVSYCDYGDLPAKDECMFIYNTKVFYYLTEKYGNTWQKEVRTDVYGLKEWKKRKRKKE